MAATGRRIDEKTWIELNGLEQWVTIRGRDETNPLLLVLHGGPGAPMSAMAYKAFAGWDELFTVVNWDQRGAGRTFGRHGAAGCGKLTIAAMVADGLALAEVLRGRFPERPIVLMGISWGSLMGLEMVRARPELFAAYVSAGQTVDLARNEALSYEGVVARLKAQGKLGQARTLEEIGPPPYPSIKALRKQRKLLVASMPKGERKAFRDLPLALLLSPEGGIRAALAFKGGAKFSVDELWDEIMEWKLADRGLSFGVPLVFLQGEVDLQTPTALLSEIAPRLQAPTVDLQIYEDGGHLAMISHAEQFRRDLAERVRPLAVAETQPAS